jgi:uncharacterized surface anchored protein
LLIVCSVFSEIIAGNYTLTETTAPEGYTGLKIEFKFKIENDGSVIYMTNTPLISERSSLTSNKVSLIVKNKPVINSGILPSTGSRGGTFTKVAFVFVGVGALLSFGSWYFNWKKTSR